MQNQVSCNNCSLDSICLPRGLSQQEIENISRVVKAKKTLHRGEFIYHEGDNFKGVLAIKSGSAKLIATDPHGNEHILNILLPGELLGFDGLSSDLYQCSAIALETSKGNFELGLALGILLLLIAFAVNLLLQLLPVRNR